MAGTLATGPQTTGQRQGNETVPVPLGLYQIYKGCAAGFPLNGSGNAQPLDTTIPNLQFKGVWQETFNNTAGIAGTTSGTVNAGGKFTWIATRGDYAFGQTGTTITSVHIGLSAYFASDYQITLTAGTPKAGVIVSVDQLGQVWVRIDDAVIQISSSGTNWIPLTGTTAGTPDAINPHTPANYIINSTAADGCTLAAPTATIDDGIEILVESNSAYAHSVTATGLLETGSASVNKATFAAYAGCSLRLKAYQAKWYVLSQVGVTFS